MPDMWNLLMAETPWFGHQVHRSLDTLGIRAICEKLEIDHICVRFKNPHDVTRLCEELEAGLAVEISRAMIAGRMISIFQLHEPIELGPWKVRGVEVPYPKSNHRYTDGWEHVEFVLPCAPNTMEGVRRGFHKLLAKCEVMPPEAYRYDYEEYEPKVPGDQMPNPTVSVVVGGIGLKFHPRSIQDVVGYKQAA